jgi:hypothetical protein
LSLAPPPWIATTGVSQPRSETLAAPRFGLPRTINAALVKYEDVSDGYSRTGLRITLLTASLVTNIFLARKVQVLAPKREYVQSVQSAVLVPAVGARLPDLHVRDIDGRHTLISWKAALPTVMYVSTPQASDAAGTRLISERSQHSYEAGIISLGFHCHSMSYGVIPGRKSCAVSRASGFALPSRLECIATQKRLLELLIESFVFLKLGP